LPPHSHPNDAYSQLAQISQQPAEFEFPRQHLPQCFHFTGPYHNQASAASLRRCYAERGSQKAKGIWVILLCLSFQTGAV
jgi:hypothetical protein